MTGKPKVLIADYINDELHHERTILGDLAEVVALDAHSESELAEHIADANAIMLYHNVGISETSIRRLLQCKLIARCGVGVDNVDLVSARAHGIPVSNVPDYGTEEVADSAMGMVLSLARGIHRLNTIYRHADPPVAWSHEAAAPIFRLRTRTLGIVGLGRIGTAMARRANALGMRVIYFDPLLPEGFRPLVEAARVASLRELIEQSYIVTLHCPLNEATRQMINEDSLQWFQPGSYLVNTSRGPVVDTTALPDAIASGRLAGAGIDVLPSEPPVGDDPMILAWRDPTHPAYERLIVNPHAAFYCEEGFVDMRTKASENCRRALLGESLLNVVN